MSIKEQRLDKVNLDHFQFYRLFVLNGLLTEHFLFLSFSLQEGNLWLPHHPTLYPGKNISLLAMESKNLLFCLLEDQMTETESAAAFSSERLI